MECANCGLQFDESIGYCPLCVKEEKPEPTDYNPNNKKQKSNKSRTIIAVICFILTAAGILFSSIGVSYCDMLDHRIVNCKKFVTLEYENTILQCKAYSKSLTKKINTYDKIQYEIHQAIEASDFVDLSDKFIELEEATYKMNEEINRSGLHYVTPDTYERNFFLKKAYEINKERYYAYTNTGNYMHYASRYTEMFDLHMEFSDPYYEPEKINFSMEEKIEQLERGIEYYNKDIERDQKLLDKYSVYVILGYIASYLLTITGLVVLLHKKKHNTEN